MVDIIEKNRLPVELDSLDGWLLTEDGSAIRKKFNFKNETFFCSFIYVLLEKEFFSHGLFLDQCLFFIHCLQML